MLLDPDAERLDVVGGLAGRILARQGWPGRLTLTGDRSAALDGAAFTLVQLRVGGQAARLVDETLPHRFGAIGQETTGPGGFAKALRTVPLVLEIAEEAARRGAPGSWLLDFTNPVGIVTQALLDGGLPGDRAVQRRDRVPAVVRAAVRRRRPTASGSITSASTTCRGSGTCGSTTWTACRSCSTAATRP